MQAVQKLVLLLMVLWSPVVYTDDEVYDDVSPIVSQSETTVKPTRLSLLEVLGQRLEGETSRPGPSTTTTASTTSTTTRKHWFPSNRPHLLTNSSPSLQTPTSYSKQTTPKSPPPQEITQQEYNRTPKPTNTTVVLVAVISTVGMIAVTIVIAVTVVMYKRKFDTRSLDVEANTPPNDYRGQSVVKSTAKDQVTSGLAMQPTGLVQINAYTNSGSSTDTESIYEVIAEDDVTNNPPDQSESKSSRPLPNTPLHKQCTNDYIVFYDVSLSPCCPDDDYGYARNGSLYRREDSNNVGDFIEEVDLTPETDEK